MDVSYYIILERYLFDQCQVCQSHHSHSLDVQGPQPESRPVTVTVLGPQSEGLPLSLSLCQVHNLSPGLSMSLC